MKTNTANAVVQPKVIIIEFFLPNFLFSINEAANSTGNISKRVDNKTFKISFYYEESSFVLFI